MDGYHPVFVGGEARSGTTLLVDLLGLHPDLAPIYETNFLVRIFKALSGDPLRARLWAPWKIRRIMRAACRDLGAPSSVPDPRGANERFFHGGDHVLLDPDLVMRETDRLVRHLRWGAQDAAVGNFVTALFAEHCRREGKPAWVNKTPRYVLYWPQLHAAFPDMRLVHIVRDGRDAACSRMRLWGSEGVAEAARLWAEAVRMGRAFGARYPEQYLEVTYETLLERPADELDRVFAWLGLEPCAETVMRTYREAGFSIDASRVGRWRSILSAQDLAAFDRVAGDLLGGARCGQDE